MDNQTTKPTETAEKSEPQYARYSYRGYFYEQREDFKHHVIAPDGTDTEYAFRALHLVFGCIDTRIARADAQAAEAGYRSASQLSGIRTGAELLRATRRENNPDDLI